MIELDDIPGGPELVVSLGLEPDHVEAYVSPNVLGCERSLSDCVPVGENGARGIAHLPTGFPLYAEESWNGGINVWLEAEAIRWADPTIAPVPVETIPRQSQRAETDALIGKPEDEVVGRDDVRIVRRDGQDLEQPSDAQPGRFLISIEDGVITDVRIEADPAQRNR